MRKGGPWFFNRVILGLLLFLVLVGFWEFKWKPQYRPYYEQGVRYYQAGRYAEALTQFDTAYNIAPNAVDVMMMEGWTTLKLNRFDDSRFYFNRVLKIDSRLEEAQIGSAFVAMETGRGKLDYKILLKYLGKRLNDPNVSILVAAALLQDGRTFEAADLYSRLQGDPNYGEPAVFEFKKIFGMEGFNDRVPTKLPTRPRPAQLQTVFRAANNSMWKLGDKGWQKFYVSGVNLGPGAPGYFPAAPPYDGRLYTKWLQKSEELNANTIRVYTLLPPAFYRAYKHHMDAGGKITLYQQIWVSDPPNKDLYEPKFVEETKMEIRYAVDAIHGSGDVPPKRARGNGIYDQDISEHVGAILLGRELEASVAIQTNIINGGKQRYLGKYISIPTGTATEVWFAEMLDYLVNYETEKYNWQHPVAIVNWPPLDPLFHPTEAPNMQEVKFRIMRGEKLEMPKEAEDDNDTVSIDEAKYQITPAFYAGFFASYHVYPYYPDFLLFDPQYLNARDSESLNPMHGYISDLRKHIPYPLVITEYGIPDSMGISHFHPLGWHHGGHSEEQQGAILRQLSRSIKENGCAGGIVFSLIDEWYKHNWLNVDFEDPVDRAALWLNELDPEKHYGLLGFRPSKWKLFAGEAADWQSEPKIYERHAGGSGPISVQASSDEAFVYLRINGACTECLEKPAKSNRTAYAIALNTVAGRGVGLRQLPFAETTIATGANFLLYLAGAADTRLLIADDYNPYVLQPKPGVPNETELNYRHSFTPRLEGSGTFQELLVETNRRRFGRDGTMYPGQRYSRSTMRYATFGDRAKDSLAEWYTDPKSQAVVVRISWGKLLVTDPSSRRAFFGFDSQRHVITDASTGIEISLFELKQTGAGQGVSSMVVANSFPAVVNGTVREPNKMEWKRWEKVSPELFEKKSFVVMQKQFLEQQREDKTDGSAGSHAGTGTTTKGSSASGR
jgi:tetratricopeptide (TPR) repeat protein